MGLFSLRPESAQVIEMYCGDRWQIYHRLQELDIPCWCATDQPLRIEIKDVSAAIQLQSVMKQIKASRQELTSWLEQCWNS